MKTSNIINVGKRNNIFQHIIVLKTNRYKRNDFQEFFVEGVHNIKLALKYGWTVKNWIISNKKLSSWATTMLETVKTEANYCFTDELLSEISERTDTSEIMAVFQMKKMTVTASKNPFIIIFDRPSKKGNLGTIMRSADAFGCDGIIVTGHSVDIYDPEVLSASMGSFFAVLTERIESNKKVEERLYELKQQFPELVIVATTEVGETSIREANFNKPLILLVGNEASGLSKFYLDICDQTVKIPMVGEATSFNVANATSIFMYEVFSQRQNQFQKNQ